MFTKDQIDLSRIRIIKLALTKKTVKFVHLAGNSIFMHRMSILLKKNFNLEEHIFLLLDANDHGNYVYPSNFFPVTPDMLALPGITGIINRAQKIFIHSLWSDAFIDLLMTTSGAPEKTQWIAWGADLYDYPATPKRKALVARLQGIIVHTPEEWIIACEKFASNIMWTGWGPFYDSGEMKLEYDAFQEGVLKKDRSRINVLVGHRAYEGLDHENIFRLLARKFSGKLDVFSVLAYGNRNYTQRVIAVGKEVWGENFHPVTTFVSATEYYAFLKNMDIGIFAQERSQGLGNITSLLYLGKKVFIRKNSPNSSFLSMLGAECGFVEELDNLDLDRFRFNNRVIANHKAMKRLKNGDLAKMEWQKILYGTPLRYDNSELAPAYADYSDERLKKIGKENFWVQVRRTRNGEPFPDDQMEIIYNEIKRILQFNPDDVLLDLACGNGRLAQEFIPLIAGYHGVDLSSGLIQIARENFSSKTSTFTESDIESWLDREIAPDRYTKCLFYGGIAYFSIASIHHILLLLNRKFRNIGKVFVGPIPDRDKSGDFYMTNDYDLNDFTSSIGMWHRRDDFRIIAENCGWDAQILSLPETAWQNGYRFNTVLTRKSIGR